MNLASVEDLVFFRLQAFWCLMTKPDRFRWVGDFGIFHKQVGLIQVLYSPLGNCLLYLHVGLDSGPNTPSHATLISRAPTLFGELYHILRFCCIPDFMLIFLYLLCRSCEEPWNKEESSILGLHFWCEDRDDTFGLSQLSQGRRQAQPASL